MNEDEAELTFAVALDMGWPRRLILRGAGQGGSFVHGHAVLPAGASGC
jgi:hypothetical protein